MAVRKSVPRAPTKRTPPSYSDCVRVAGNFGNGLVEAMFNKATEHAGEGRPTNKHYIEAAKELLTEHQANLSTLQAQYAQEEAAKAKAVEDQNTQRRATTAQQLMEAMYPQRANGVNAQTTTGKEAPGAPKAVNKDPNTDQQHALARWLRHVPDKTNAAGEVTDRGANTRSKDVLAKLGEAAPILAEIEELIGRREAYSRTAISSHQETDTRLSATKNLAQANGQIADAFTRLENALGRNNIDAALKKLKSDNKARNKTAAHIRFSSVYSEWKNGRVTDKAAATPASSKTMRERNELKEFRLTNLAESALDGWKLNPQQKIPWTGLKAVLMRIHHGLANSFSGSLSGAIFDLLKQTGVAQFDIRFYTDEGLVVSNGGKSLSVDKTQQAPHPIAMTDLDNRVIHIGPKGQNAEVILHEALHSVAVGWLQQHADSDEAHVLNTLREYVLGQLNKHPELRAKLHEDTVEADKLIAALSDPKTGSFEFLSYGMTHGGLQEAMKAMKPSRAKAVLEYIVDALSELAYTLRSILGMAPTKANVHALSQFLQVGSNIIEQSSGDAGTGTLNATSKASTGFNKVASFLRRLAETPAARLFKVAKMDDSVGTPRKAFTFAEIADKHMPPEDGWTVTEWPADRVAAMTNPDGKTKVVKAWRAVAPAENGGELWVYEDANGRVTVSAPDSLQGKTQGWRVLHAALAYAFYNHRVFAGEHDEYGMSDRAVLRYAEAMLSAAIKFGSTDFMEPSRRLRNPADTLPDDEAAPAFLDDAKAGKWGMSTWTPSNKRGNAQDRFRRNVGLLAKFTRDIVFADRPELDQYAFDLDTGFSTPDGNKATGLSTAEMRAILSNTIAGMSENVVHDTSLTLEMRDSAEYDKAGISQLFAVTTSQPNAGGMPTTQGVVHVAMPDMTRHAPKTALLEPLFRSMLPGLWGDDPKVMQKATAWAADMAAKLRKHSPTLAAFLSKVNAGFNVSPEFNRIVELFKLKRNQATTQATEFTKWLEDATPAEAQSAIAFMDAYAADNKATTSLPDHVKYKIVAAVTAMQQVVEDSTELSDEFKALRPSEQLTYALQSGNVAGKGFGARESIVESGSEFRISPADVVMKGPAGRFHPVVDSKGDIVRMVAEAAGTQPLAPGERLDNTRLYFFVREDKKKSGDYVFRKQGTATELFTQDDANRKIAVSFLNTVYTLSNAVATRRLARDMAAKGPAAGMVFTDTTKLLNYINKGRPQDQKMSSIHVFKLSSREAKSAVIRAEYRKPGSWVQLPDSEAYGALAGKVVAGPLWTRLSDAINRDALVDSQIYNGLIRSFKAAKTVYSPSTSATNVMTNFTLAYLNDIPWRTVREALGVYLRYKTAPGTLTPQQHRLMAAFFASGATQGDFTTTEVKQSMYEAMAAMSESSKVGFFNTLAEITNYNNSFAQKAAKLAAKTGRGVHEIMSDAYATGDNMFRFAAFMREYGRLQKEQGGLSEAEMLESAGLYAKKVFLDYDNDSRLLHALRQSILPFASWGYVMSARLAEIAVTQPWKLATLALVYSMVSGALSAGEGDEDRKRRRRTGHDSTTWFGAYKDFKFGDTYFNAARWFAPSPIEFKDAPNGFMGLHSWPGSITPSNPITNSLMYMFGFDPYTGKTFTKEANDPLDNTLLAAAKIYNQFTFPAAQVTSVGGQMRFRAQPALNDIAGMPSDQMTHYARLLLPVTSESKQASRKALEYDIKATERAFDTEISAVKRSRAIGRITGPNADKTIAELRKRKQERVAELRKDL